MKCQLSKKLRNNLIRICVVLAAFVVVFATDKAIGLAEAVGGKYGWLLPFFLYLGVYLAIAYDVLWKAVRNILGGELFDENLLMCIASLGAFGLAIFRSVKGMPAEGFEEACAVILFYQIGEFFQSYAVGKSRSGISELMDIRPDSANVIRDGEAISVSPEEVAIGELILINPGEKVPLDGRIEEGASSFDLRALTGESLPKDMGAGDMAISGSVNLTSSVKVRVEKEFHDSTASKILELVENAADKKAVAENFITRFARFYTPAVVAVALLLAIIPSVVTGDWISWIYRALSFLVVSCPCALVISVPLSFFAGIGAASRYGILVKGSAYLERLNKANIFVFDKTGTLTKGAFAVTKVVPEERWDELLHLAAMAEQGSSHPIARSICELAGECQSDCALVNEAGMGVIATSQGHEILVGNFKLMQAHGIVCYPAEDVGTAVYVAKDGEYRGYILVEDLPKDEAKEVVAALNASGKTVMLTGDNEAVARKIATELGVSAYKASLLPADKVDEVEALLAAKGKRDALCYVGDGINDAPVLMRSDIGVAMGGLGSDAAIEASDIVLMKDDLRALPLAKRIAKRTYAVVMQNIVFALAVKLVILLLSAFGITNMWMAVFGDVGVAFLAILNAMRVNTKRGYEAKSPKPKIAK